VTPALAEPAGGKWFAPPAGFQRLDKPSEVVCHVDMPTAIQTPRRAVVRGSTLTEADDTDVEFELDSPDQFFGSHIGLIPLRSAVAGPRLFYGARFYNQALPLPQAEAPLVQALADKDEQGRSFDEILGKAAGARLAKADGVVRDVTPDWIELELSDGKREQVELYNKLPFNRKTSLTNTPVVKPGDQVRSGQVLAKSNFTDAEGRLAMGLNARIGLVPYLGKSMDDAVVVSDAFARRLSSEHLYGYDLDNRNGIKFGKAHYAGIFPGRFIKDQLEKLDDDGVVRPGMLVQPGDPLILATRPRVVSSTSAQLGLLSKHMKNARTNAALLWDHDEPGTVTDVVRLPDGSAKVNVQVIEPTRLGDKIVMRSGQKGIISEILPDDQMPRTADGHPLEVLLNPLGIPSRVNNSLVYELLLGKAARKSGKPFKLPAFLPEGQQWDKIVEQHLKDAGLTDTEEVYDPKFGRKLERPVTVGDGYVLKLHHTSASKISTRGQGSYTCFDDITEVCTRRGWVAWPDVTADDEFATADDGKLVFSRASRITKEFYSGELVGFEGRYLDWLVTPNHNLLVKFRKPSSRLRMERADALFGRSFYVPQFGFAELHGRNPRRFVLSGRVIRDTLGRVYNTPGFECEFEDFADFAGWWLSEGEVRLTEGRVKLYQSEKANPAKFQQIESLLKRLGVAFNAIRRNGVGVGWQFANKSLAFFLASEFGSGSVNKKIPEFMLSAGLSARRRMYSSMMLGDGTADSSGMDVCYNTCSKRLADDFQRLCIGLGFGSVISYRPATTSSAIRGRVVHSGPIWRCGVSLRRKFALVENYSNRPTRHYRQHYEGFVYCATIPVTGLLLVRRNGKPMWSGNSNEQPAHGGGETAQAKRLSGLESRALISSGAYNVLREGATLRGQRNDEYWRQLHMGLQPRDPGRPFMFSKFLAMLSGAGYLARKLPKDRYRLQFMTDRDLDGLNPTELSNGEIVDIGTFEPVKGGLFDPSITGRQSWGAIRLPQPMPNPAAEDVIRKLLGLTQKEFRSVLSGEMELPVETLQRLRHEQQGVGRGSAGSGG